jgi:hypothetical protein
LLFAAATIAVPARADIEFQVRRMTRTDVPLGVGQCDIRVMIDNEADVSVQGDRVYIRTLQGREGRDAGSECNMPLPRGFMDGFNFQMMDGRGDMTLISEPTSRFGSGAVVRIRDNQGGEDRYHFRISWNDRGATTSNSPNRPGRGWGRGGRWGNTQGLRFSEQDAVGLCNDTVQDSISRDYRYNNVQILNSYPDNRSGVNEWITGEAVARRGFFSQDFTFACRVNYNRGTVTSLDIRRR